jgi:hypothetical protein
MRVPAVLFVALVGLAGCSRNPTYEPQSNVNETISITASSEAIRGLESDLRNELKNRRSDEPASVGFNESSGPRPRTVGTSPTILNAAFDDAHRKATALAASVHARLGDPIAVDEINAADPMPRPGDIGLKGMSMNASRVTVNGDGPEIVRVTFALSGRAHAPATITVYGMQATRAAVAAVQPPTQLAIAISTNGNDPLATIASWESFVRDASRRRGIRDADITVGNVNANLVRRPR